MNILLNIDIEDRHIRQIRSVAPAPDHEIMKLCSDGEMLEVMPDVDIVFGEISEEMFTRAKRLRWVQVTGAGVDARLFPDFVDSEVVFTSAKGRVGVHLAEHAMALLLGLTRGIATAVRNPGWHQRMPIRNAAWELAGLTMGIIGLGGTGRELAKRAHGFDMRVIAVDPEDIEVPETVEACWKMDRLFDLLGQSDVVAVCAPLTAETEGMFGREAFAQMPDHALLINVTRGGLMDEGALMEALKTGQIGGAGLDVTPKEPLPDDHPFWRMDNVILTPHVAGGSPRRMDRMVDLFCENMQRLLEGEPMLSVIDKKKGY